jgi:hypothetical protein
MAMQKVEKERGSETVLVGLRAGHTKGTYLSMRGLTM